MGISKKKSVDQQLMRQDAGGLHKATVRVPDELWHQANMAALVDRTSVSLWVVDAIEAHLKLYELPRRL